jgi:radical SAM-linked protein
MAKSGDARWISHLDLTRAIERALRRAHIDVAYSQGYNPLPRLSFASALTLGATSQAEYFEVDLARPMRPAEFQSALEAQLPPGLEVREVCEVPPTGPPLAATVKAATYRVTVRLPEADDRAALRGATVRFLQSPSHILSRRREGKTRLIDARPLVPRLEVTEGQDCLELEMDIILDPRGTVKPEEVVAALAETIPITLVPGAVRTHRVALQCATISKGGGS